MAPDQANQPFVSPNTLPLTPVSQPASYTEQANSERMNVYFLRHNQMARTASRQGFVSYVPIVATPVDAVASEGDEAEQAAGQNATTEPAERQ